MCGAKLPDFVISPTRMTMASPVLAEKVQLSESPTGEIVPVNVSPEAIGPCAPATGGWNVVSTCAAKMTTMLLAQTAFIVISRGVLQRSVADQGGDASGNRNVHKQKTARGSLAEDECSRSLTVNRRQ